MGHPIHPIVIFAYARPVHLKRTLDSLAANPGSSDHPLYIFCDGPSAKTNMNELRLTRSIAASEQRFPQKEIYLSDVNKGLANSIIEGETSILNRYESVIVLEDDMEVSPNYLDYMRQGLDKYREHPQVASICGYMYPINANDLPDVFFLKGTDCWGWGTWQRAWAIFEANGKNLLEKLHEKNLTYEFDYDGAYPYVQMLKDQILGRNNSWAIRWHASAYLLGMLSCFPKHSFVKNIGLDGTGTHCGTEQHLDVDLSAKNAYSINEFPDDVSLNHDARNRIRDFFLSSKNPRVRLKKITNQFLSLFRFAQ